MLYLITGEPGSGKSYLVAERAKPNDLIIDLDRIALAFTTGCDSHDYLDHVRDVAIGARQAAIGRALKHIRRCDVWIIHASPTDQQRRMYARYQATEIACKASPEVIAQRIAQRPPRNQALIRRINYGDE